MNLYYYLLMIICWCSFIYPIKSQWYYSTYNQFPFIPTPQLIPQSFYQPLPPISIPRAAVTYNLPTNHENTIKNTAEYRGFSYRTEFKDGASSTVFFVTGPEAQQLQKTENFPFLQRNNNQLPINNNNNKARNLASNILDHNAFNDINKQIEKTLLKPIDFQMLFADNSVSGITHYYNFPASTVPLSRTLDIKSNNLTETTITTEDTTTDVTTTTSTTTTESPNQDSIEVEAAESILKDSKILINDISSASEISDKSSTTIQTNNDLKEEITTINPTTTTTTTISTSSTNPKESNTEVNTEEDDTNTETTTTNA